MTHQATALIGVPLTMEQDVIYATPVRGTTAYVQPQTATLEVSMTTEDADFVGVTPVEGQVFTTAPFIRCTDASGCIILFKAA